VLRAPFSETKVPVATFWSGPALAIGLGTELTITVSGILEMPRLLVTTRLNTRFTPAVSGAVNVGDIAVELLRVTFDPDV
jgi:hypothetical protein